MDKNDESMDTEKPGIPEQENEQYSSECSLAGPMNLMVCLSFILCCQAYETSDKYDCIDIEKIIDCLSTNNENLDNRIDQLWESAKNYSLNICLCILKHGERRFYKSNDISGTSRDQWPMTYIVFNECSQSYYSFFTQTHDLKRHTTFSANDKHYFSLFQDSVKSYNWADDFNSSEKCSYFDSGVAFEEESIEESTLAPTQTQPENMLNTVGVYEVLLDNIKQLLQCLATKLNDLDCTFPLSTYMLHNNDFSSEATICKALIRQCQLLETHSNTTIQRCLSDSTLPQSMESNDTTMSTLDKSPSIPSETISNHVANNQNRLLLNPASTVSVYNDVSNNTANNHPEVFHPIALELLNQPKRYLRFRYLKELAKNGCSILPVEGASQRTHLTVKFSSEIKTFQQISYLGCHVVTYDKKKHDQVFVVPEDVSAKLDFDLKSNNLDCLIHGKNNEFDRATNGVFSRIDPNRLEKEVLVKIVSFYQSYLINEQLIREKKLKWCRLMLGVYIKTSNGQFRPISLPVYTELIAHTTGSQSVAIDSKFPERLCVRGGQMVFVQLNENCNKHDLHVNCNGKRLNDKEFQISGTMVSFESPPCTQDSLNLKVEITNLRTNVSKTFEWLYHLHDNHLDPCGVF